MNHQKTIRHYRQVLSSKIWKLSDKLHDFNQEVYVRESRFFERIQQSLPTPSYLLDKLQGVIAYIALEVDEVCPRCKTSPCPGHGSAYDSWKKYKEKKRNENYI